MLFFHVTQQFSAARIHRAAIHLGLVFLFALIGSVALLPTGIAQTKKAASPTDLEKAPGTIRFASFNVSFYRKAAGKLLEDLTRDDLLVQPRRVAEVIQRVRPDVLLLNEFDYDEAGKGIKAFQENLLGVSQNGQQPIEYPHVYFAAVNTGMPSGVDLNNDGKDRRHWTRRFWVWHIPWPIRDGGIVAISNLAKQSSHLSNVSLERHARQPAAHEGRFK